jgi:putative RNA 2'-phosphotransferase
LSIAATGVGKVHKTANTPGKRRGKRYSKPHIFTVNAKGMHDAGFLFYCSENNVWLTEKVPVEYLLALPVQ